VPCYTELTTAMIAEALLPQRIEPDGMRQFDIRRDLSPLADLVELVFSSESDQGVISIASEMRRLARVGPILWLFDPAYSAISPLVGGYVWVAEGRLVGNVTVSAESRRRGLRTISNVAVHPDFRGRGIARQLMEAALQDARQSGVREVALEVRADNLRAQSLYCDLGFGESDSIAEMRLPAHELRRIGLPPAVPLRARRVDDWRALQNLYLDVVPPKAQAVKPVLADQYRLTFGRRLQRWLDDVLYLRQTKEWVVEADGELTAFLQVIGQYVSAPHRLQMDVKPGHRGVIEEQLVGLGLDRLGGYPVRDVAATVSMSHPEAYGAFQRRGFLTSRVLSQMHLYLRPQRG